MSRVELLRAGSLKAEAQYRQELSSIQSLRHEESKERHRVAETRKEFWKQASAAASLSGRPSGDHSPLSASERMWRAHDNLQDAAAKHGDVINKLMKGGERLACTKERIDVLQKMISSANRHRAHRLENQSSDDLGDLLASIVKKKRSTHGEIESEVTRPEMTARLIPHHTESRSAAGLRLFTPEGQHDEHKPPVLEGVARDSILAVRAVSSESAENQKTLTVECSMGTKGAVSVALVKRDGEAIRAVVSPEGNQLALLAQRDKALVLSRLQAMGVRVGSVTVGDDSLSASRERAGQRAKRRLREDEDESRIA